MVTPVEFSLGTELAQGLKALVEKLEERLGLRDPIKMFIAGGMAAHLYTGARVTTDVDAEFSKRILLPSDLIVETAGGTMLYIDANYNSTFALMHEDYLDDALPVPITTGLIQVYVLSPVDLVVSKIARFSGPDAEDIESIIARFKLPASDIQRRAEEALGGYVGDADYLRMNLRDVVKIAERLAEAVPPGRGAGNTN
jgi:hypothetical protein